MNDTELIIGETSRVVLAVPSPDAAPRVVQYLKRNSEHFAPWNPPAPEGLYTEAYWHQRLAVALEEARQGTQLRLMLRSRTEPSHPIVGDIGFTAIVRGPFQACYLGYRLDHELVGQGVMYEALKTAIGHVFGALKLHRIMANYMPHNVRSAHLLRRLGFVPEGYARDYLFLAGAWQDHVLTALTNPSV